MSENKKENDEKKKSPKKVEKKISITKENLEKLIEKKEESKKINKAKIIPENFSFEDIKLNKKVNVSLDKINSSQQQKVHFLERNLEKETNFKNEKKDDSNYISRTEEKENPKYQRYESDMNIKLNRPEEMGQSWRDESKLKNVAFISSENANLNQQTHYANYTQPERFNQEKFNREKQKGKVIERVDMKYSSKH
jgi:hypothetical protein